MSQKKKEIKASLTDILFKSLTDKAKDHGVSFQEYISRLAVLAANDERVIRSIAAWFRRAYKLNGELWMGHVIAKDYEDLLPEGKLSVRRSLKLDEEDHLRICEVAYAIDCKPTVAAEILLFAAHLAGVDLEDTEDARTESAG